MHCCNIEIIQKEGKEMLSFELLDPGYPGYMEKNTFMNDTGISV